MKIKKIRKNKSKIISLIIIVIIVLAVVCFWYWKTYLQADQTPINNVQSTDQVVNYNPPTVDQRQSGEDIRANHQTPMSTTASTTITAKNITTDILQIRGITNGAVSSEGTCNLSLTKDGLIVSKSVATYAMPSSSTCQGFDIDRKELSSGTWQINLDVIIDGEKSSATGEVTLE